MEQDVIGQTAIFKSSWDKTNSEVTKFLLKKDFIKKKLINYLILHFITL